MIKSGLILFFSISFLTMTTTANASVVINEIYPYPKSQENEWVELFNSSDENIDLSNWHLQDEISSVSTIYNFENEQIQANSYLVVEITPSKLNNSGDTINLLDSQNQIIDSISYTNAQLEKSFGINNHSEDSEILLMTPTKGAENIVDESTNTSAENQDSEDENNNQNQNYLELSISEIMACPFENEPEWIKIKNENDLTVDLLGWTSKDSSDNQIDLKNLIVDKKSGLKINLPNNILNNSGDKIFLINPKQEIVDEFEYNNCRIGESISLQTEQNNFSNNYQEEEEIESKITERKMSDSIESNQVIDTSEIDKFVKINSLLYFPSFDKSSTQKTSPYLSSMIKINQQKFSTDHLLSVIIGGVLLISSGLIL